jgi:2-isopropylmalate synthase
VALRTPEGETITGSFTGDGPVDAIFRAINTATGVDAKLREFRVDAVTGGQDALGETSVVVEVQGISGSGQGVSTDILEAAARAYVRALSAAARRAARAAAGEVPAAEPAGAGAP